MRMNRTEWHALLNGWVAEQSLLKAEIDLPPLVALLFVRSVAVAPFLRLVTDDGRANFFMPLDESAAFEYTFEYDQPSSGTRQMEGVERRLTISFHKKGDSLSHEGRIVLSPATDETMAQVRS